MKKLLLFPILLVCLCLLITAKDFTNSVSMKFIDIPSGSFMMGTKALNCPKDDPFTEKNEKKSCIDSVSSDEFPYHKVFVKSFYMSNTEVTQLQYWSVMKKNPAHFKTEKLEYYSQHNPIERVSWHDANEFIKALNKKENTNKYKLPSEQEWEYSSKANSDKENKLEDYAWYDGNSDDKTHPVAKKKPNKFNLYDMQGNVWEWTSSCYTKNYLIKCEDNPNSYKVIRGGSWYDNKKDTRLSNRDSTASDFEYFTIGFRVAKEK